MIDYFPLLFAVLVVLVAFRSAMNNGVVKLLASGCAAAAAMAAFLIGFHLLTGGGGEMLHTDLDWKAAGAISAGAALLVYGVARIAGGWIFRRALGPDSPFHWFADGVPGGIVSLGPSLVVVFFLFTCTRIAGTVLELNYAASLSDERIMQAERRPPPYPFAAKWRNAVESVPLLAPALDLVDPVSHRIDRNAAAMVLMTRSGPLTSYLERQPSTAGLAERELFPDLLAEPSVDRAVDEHDRVALVTAPPVEELSEDRELARELRGLDLEPILEGFAAHVAPDPQPTAPATPGAQSGASI